MFRTVMHRYGSKEVEEHDTLEEAISYGKSLSDCGEGFFEYVIDESNTIIYDGKESVIGITNESEVGKKYSNG